MIILKYSVNAPLAFQQFHVSTTYHVQLYVPQINIKYTLIQHSYVLLMTLKNVVKFISVCISGFINYIKDYTIFTGLIF